MKRWFALLMMSSAAFAICDVAMVRSSEAASNGSFTSDELAQILKLSPLPPVPPDPTNHVADNPAAAHLGQFLFFDKRLSANGQVSCTSCHDPARNWSDGQAVPIQFSPELRHVPSLWNVAYNRWFFWDGRADSLWSQALQPLEHAQEHAGNRLQYVRLVYNDEQLHRAYENVFGPLPATLQNIARSAEEASTNPSTTAEVTAAHMGRPRPKPEESHREDVDRTFTNLGKTMAAYERHIVSRKAPFDVFVEGLKTGDSAHIEALSPDAQRGLKLFIGRANCRSCHHGPNFTDGEFHDTGVELIEPRSSPDLGRFVGVNTLLRSPFNTNGAYNDDPDGRQQRPTWYLVNSNERKGQFKTPSLRNVAVTAPYMHRGQLKTLDDVIRYYSTLRRPGQVDPPPNSVGSIIGQSGHTHIAGASNEHLLVPLNLSKSESDDLIAFLKSLTDVKIDPALTTQPASPVYR